MKRLLWLFMLLAAPMAWAQGSNVGCNPVLALCGGPLTVATLPAVPAKGTMAAVSDGASSSDCTVGHGTTLVTCQYNGSAWVQVAGGGGGGGGFTPNSIQYGVTTSTSRATTYLDVAALWSCTGLLSSDGTCPQIIAQPTTLGFTYISALGSPDTMLTVAPSGTKCYPYGGSSGYGCDTPTAGGSGVLFWNPAVCVVQGAGVSLGGTFTAVAAPSAVYTVGSGTVPNSCGAAFPAATKGTQYMEWHKILEPEYPSNNAGQLTWQWYLDSTNAGNVVWGVQFGCGAAAATVQPTYAAEQTTAAVAGTGTANQTLTSTIATPTLTCAAGDSLWARTYLDSTTTATGNIVLTDFQFIEAPINAVTTFSGVVALWTACSSGYLKFDGTCATPAGSGTVTTSGSPASTYIASFSGASVITGTSTATIDGSGNITATTVTTTPVAGTNGSMGFTGGATPPTITGTAKVWLFGPPAAPTAWSLQLPTAPFTTGHLFDTTVTGTNSLLHDTGIATANVMSMSTSFTAGQIGRNTTGTGTFQPSQLDDDSTLANTLTYNDTSGFQTASNMRVVSTGYFGWNPGTTLSTAWASNDTRMSRASAGVVSFDTTTTGNAAGTVKAATGTFGTAATVGGYNVPKIIASGAQALGTPTITQGTCSASPITATATGALASDRIIASPAIDPSGVSGYAPSTTGSLYVIAYITTDTANFKICYNGSLASLAAAALSMNWSVER